MYSSNKKYNLPNKKALNQLVDEREFDDSFELPYIGEDCEVSKTDLNSKCENIFNLSKYMISKSIIEKNDVMMHMNLAKTLPLNKIKDCDKFTDFVSSLHQLDIKLTIAHDVEKCKNKPSEFLLYHIDTNQLLIFCDNK